MQILTALGRHPLGSTSAVSREADMTPPTYSRRLRRMYLDRVLLSISAELSFPSLGMEPVLYFM